MYLRAQRLESVDIPPYHDENAQVVIRRRNGKDQGYEYLATVPYEHWMLDGRIELREQVYGCVNCSEGKAEQVLPGNILPAFIPDYRICTIVPEPEPVKVRAETRTARLQFRQDSYRILPGYKDNRSELDTVSHSIQLVEDNEDVSITGIFITGYASPEGTVAHNLKLSENRAKALADYICRHDKFDPAMIHVDWKGEDWEGFRLVLDKFPGLLKRGEVVRIIDECTGDRDVCEKQLQELVPADIYHRLLNEIYPLLRRNEYKIEYNVRNFNLDEARRMVDEVDRLDRVVSELLQFARPAAMPRSDGDVRAVIRHALRLAEADLQAKSIRVTEDLPPDFPNVPIHAERLTQALLNLFLNAAQAMSSGGTLRVCLTPLPGNALYRITVTDTGPGIAEAALSSIFTPYFTTRPSGTGLGLSIALQIVEGLGGRLHAANVGGTPGQGAEFTLILPLRPNTDANDANMEDADANRSATPVATPHEPPEKEQS